MPPQAYRTAFVPHDLKAPIRGAAAGPLAVTSNAFDVNAGPATVLQFGTQPPTSTIAYAAYKTVRQDEPAFSVDLIYYQMYMLAIGIQGAGPNLNPSTFEAGMFAYPPKLGPVGLWKFSKGDRTAANDVREIYWDPKAISTYNGKLGAYLGTSKERWQSGQIPKGDPGKPVS